MIVAKKVSLNPWLEKLVDRSQNIECEKLNQSSRKFERNMEKVFFALYEIFYFVATVAISILINRFKISTT